MKRKEEKQSLQLCPELQGELKLTMLDKQEDVLAAIRDTHDYLPVIFNRS